MLFLDERAASAAMAMEWWRDLWSHLAAGMRWAMDDASNPALLT